MGSFLQVNHLFVPDMGGAKIECEILLHNVWQEVEYWFDVAEATHGADVELY
jgi:hypothetical protein